MRWSQPIAAAKLRELLPHIQGELAASYSRASMYVFLRLRGFSEEEVAQAVRSCYVSEKRQETTPDVSEYWDDIGRKAREVR